jgi:predicted transcriptional regulator
LRFEKNGKELSDIHRDILSSIGEEEISSSRIAKELGISKPTVLRKLNDLLEMRLVEKSGKGPGVRYSLTGPLEKRKR